MGRGRGRGDTVGWKGERSTVPRRERVSFWRRPWSSPQNKSKWALSPCRGCLEVLCAIQVRNDRRGQVRRGQGNPLRERTLVPPRALQRLTQLEGFARHLLCPHSTSRRGIAEAETDQAAGLGPSCCRLWAGPSQTDSRRAGLPTLAALLLSV